MKSRINHFSTCLKIFLLVSLTISPLLSLTAQTKFDFDFSFNKYNFYNGERLTMLPKIVVANSPTGASFVKIDYYWNDSLIISGDKAPFKLDYLLKGQSIGTHTLKVAAYATGNDLPIFGPFNFEYKIKVLGTLDENAPKQDSQTKFDFDFSFNKYSLYNGERLTMLPKIIVANSPAGASFVKIDYYWDDSLIISEDRAPFKLNYLLKNQSKGAHTLKVAVYATGNDLPIFGPFNFEYRINIIK